MAKSKVILLTLVLLISVAFKVSAAASTVSIMDTDVSQGESVTVSVDIDGVVDVVGAHILLEYDSSVVQVTVTDDNGIDSVTIDLSSIGGSSSTVMSKLGGTDIWTVTTSVSSGTSKGTHNLQVSATDTNGNTNTDVSIDLVVVENRDVNEDGTCNLGDGAYLSNGVLDVPGYEDLLEGASDVDGDATIDIDDGAYLLNHKLNIQEYSTLH